MKTWVAYNAGTGEVVLWGRSSLDLIDLQAEHAVRGTVLIVDNAFDPSAEYVDPVLGELVARPELALAPPATLQIGEVWSAPQVPAQTLVTVDGRLEAELIDPGLNLGFAAAATYAVEITPPFPWRSVAFSVDVQA